LLKAVLLDELLAAGWSNRLFMSSLESIRIGNFSCYDGASDLGQQVMQR